MTLSLTSQEKRMLEGGCGPAARMAMSILVRMAEVSEAQSLLEISGAHIDSTVYIGEAGLEFAEKLANLGARVAVPTTLNVSGLDEFHWKEWAVPQDWAEKAHRQMLAYQSMGTIPTWTCAPYQTEYKPVFGQQIAWGESNAIVFANSVIGARTDRYPDLLDVCCAITGRVPAIGLHLTENRAGEILFRLMDIPEKLQGADEFYPVLGQFIGKESKGMIPVIEGVRVHPNEDQLKALGAASASSGSVALFHMIGITPEAHSLHDAFQGKSPSRMVEVGMDQLRHARNELTHTDSDRLDMVVLGSPHFSLREFQRLAPMVRGKRIHKNVNFLITSSRAMAHIAEQTGALEPILQFGAKMTVDTCILTSPMLPKNIEYLMTNSAKFAYYSPGLLGKKIAFGTLEDCVNSAVEGRVVRDDTIWKP